MTYSCTCREQILHRKRWLEESSKLFKKDDKLLHQKSRSYITSKGVGLPLANLSMDILCAGNKLPRQRFFQK